MDQSGFIWMATDRGISVFDTADESQFYIDNTNCASFTDNDVLSVFEDSSGKFWFGTRNSGVFIAERKKLLALKEKSQFKNYQPNGSDDSIGHRSVSSFFEDIDGNIWIGTHHGGVNMVRPQGETFRYYPNLLLGSSIEKQSVWGISEGPDHILWVGTDGDGLIEFDPFRQTKMHHRHQQDQNKTLSDNAILCVLNDSRGNLWLGTYSGGLNKRLSGENYFKHYRTSNEVGSVNSDDVRVLFEDSSARIWVGTNGGGLQMYDELTDSFEFMQEVGWIDIRSIVEDKSGILWLGTFGNGLLSFDPSLNQLKRYSQIDQFDSHIIFDLHYSENDVLWIGTRYKGLLKFDLKSDKITQFTDVDGLSNNTVQSIVADTNNKLMDQYQ